METFKIVNYEKDHGPGSFFKFHSLGQEEAEELKHKVASRMKLPEGISGSEIVKALSTLAVQVENMNADRPQFDLRTLFKGLRLKLRENMYLNWRHFDNVDLMASDDVLSNFYEVWYPSADDLDLIDANLNWILSIHHSGLISIISLEDR